MIMVMGQPRPGAASPPVYSPREFFTKNPRAVRLVLVALTGWGQEEDRRRSQEAGFDHHIVKPVDPFALEKLLDGLETRTSRTLLEHRSSAAN